MVLSRLRSGLSTHVGRLSFEGEGAFAALCLYAACNLKLFLNPRAPSARSHHPLPSAGSIRSVEIRAKGRLINNRQPRLHTRQLNVTTPR